MLKGLLRSTIVRVVVLVVVAFFAVVFVSLRLQNNELETKAESLRGQIEDVNDSIDELNTSLDRPMDDAYIEEIAHDQLGLRYPQEIVFYSGEGN